MGARPGSSDFAFFGQLSQLAQFDPTPAAIAAAETPRVVSWVSHLDDLSSLDIDDAAWLTREAAVAALRPFLVEMAASMLPSCSPTLARSRVAQVKCDARSTAFRGCSSRFLTRASVLSGCAKLARL
jgi:hypothetical protein